MSFTYDSSIEPWKPVVEDGDVKIRILQLHPLPWYLWWLPRSWELYVPLRASLAWVPLAEMRNPKREGTDANVEPDKTTPTDDSTNGNTSSVNHSATSTEDNPTQIKLVSRPPLSYTSYKALSYTWGDGKAKSNMYINGKKLTITLSLATALHHLRPKTGPLKIWGSEPFKIWIDQISINQEDLQEKTEQVQHMGRIYRNTEEALVWLGSAQPGSETLMDVFNKLGAFAERFELYSYYTKARYPELQAIETKQNPDDPKTIEYHAFCDSVMDDFTFDFFQSLIAFYNLPWFTRAWVVQEFSLPPKVTFVYGTKRISAETLLCVLQIIILTIGTKTIELQPHNRPLMELLETWTDKMSNTIQPFFASRQRRKKWDEGEHSGDSLYALLQKVCVEGNVQATQGCDMVYGMLGLVNDAERLRIKVEYSEKDQHVQAAITYTKTARAVIEAGKVDLLTSAQHVKADMSLPSWVPDWRGGLSHSFAEANKQLKIDSIAIAMQRKMEKDGTLPSWVPDWRLVLRRSFAWLTDEKQDPLFQASSKQPLKIHDEGNERILALDGYIVDEVEDLGGPWTGGIRVVDGSTSRFPHEEYLNLLAQVRQMCLVSKAKGHNIYPTPERQEAAHWMVPVGGLDQDESYQPLKAGPACKLKYEHCLAELTILIEAYAMTMAEYEIRAAELVEMGNRRIGDDDDKADMGRNNGTKYRLRMQEMAGKRPFISNIGYVGMGPWYMRAGDKIAIFNGASVPFIVRPVGEDQFRLMGECYCDGLMYGEFIEQGGQVQKIVLV